MATDSVWRFPVPEIGDGPPVLAFDPGLVTGFAMLVPTLTKEWTVFAGEADYDDALVTARDALAQHLIYQPVVVCESFVITTETAKKSPQPWSLESIGVLRFLARRHGCRFETQQPTEAKRFATNPRLKDVGWYKATKDGHANDALRHLYLWLVKTDRLRPRAGVV